MMTKHSVIFPQTAERQISKYLGFLIFLQSRKVELETGKNNMFHFSLLFPLCGRLTHEELIPFVILNLRYQRDSIVICLLARAHRSMLFSSGGKETVQWEGTVLQSVF